ncbi:hypothetical protein [Williamsoniiplasma luminosum]|uniref:Uncharacterized protein n=1 Tax=Williamsoniiplasma luminosum TaxID=214888 RepID=A0A2S0NKX3_9MOLU|nr:hypothetical protein [Williamsoniiplasma luminosum]AVP49659.1 MAG: hypothetical protein C5T88_03735 [Williamsoniiplasma luminosum]
MLYIGEQAILVEVQKHASTFLIGDETFDLLPNKIENAILSSANWNRALKYTNTNHPLFTLIGYFMIRFEIYLSDNKIVCLSKNSFEQKILNQSKFQNEFLQEIFDFRNRNLKHFQVKSLPSNVETLNIIEKIDLNLNHVWMGENYKPDKTKYKVYFKTGKFSFEQNSRNQSIYSFENENFQNWDLIDFKTGMFYLQGEFNLNVSVNLTFEKEDKILAQEIMKQLVAEINTSDDFTPDTKPWHLYNVTRNEEIIVETFEKYANNFEYLELTDYLNQLFKTIKINFFPTIFANKAIQKLLFQIAQTDESKTDLENNIQRFNLWTI